ncbi:MAG: mechanosensitive ion channel, partial [Eubacteriales bacterium]|nr:mechanosensitive ion channel [Eubacteriales bacterium]
MTDKLMDLAMRGGIALLTLVLGYILLKITLSILTKALKKTRLDEALHTFIINGAKVILWIILIITILGGLGVKTTSFITVLGAGGAAVALALKDSLGNIAGGIIILVNKPFSKGDTIDVAGTTGKVESIDLLVTNLKTFDNKVVTVPNGTITTSVLVNYSKEEIRRVDCLFNISYEADILLAKKILQDVANSNEDILRDPPPLIGVAGHLDSAVTIDLKVWCATENFFDIKYFLEE